MNISSPAITRMARAAAAVAGLAAALMSISAAASRAAVVPGRPAAPPAVHRVIASPTASHCATPTPSTAAGFALLFATLPADQWAAADIAISVPLADGRSVWLYGDTFSAGRFAHSTAIGQDKGCLHVSHAGAQLLPNDDAAHIYWVDSASVVPGGLAIKARSIILTGTCAWCFKDGGFFRTAYATVSPAGDVTFQRWTATTFSAPPDPGPMYYYGPHHYGYARHTHPEYRLADGAVLVTTCQNWDDGILHPPADYRPIFSG